MFKLGTRNAAVWRRLALQRVGATPTNSKHSTFTNAVRHLSGGTSSDRKRPSPEACAAFVSDLRAKGVPVIAFVDGDDSARQIKLKSRDFYWYSPILKKSLRGLHADVLVQIEKEEHVVYACAAAAKHKVPLTTRGAGTGNYGQAVPLHGGAILDVSRLDHLISMDDENGTIRVGAGMLMGDLEDFTRKSGWELRQHPSTRRTATIGGFVAGGSTGVGAVMHGGTAEDGAILGLRVVTAEETPRVLDLAGRDVFPVVHAYGTNGIITQVEIPLARAYKWHDAVVAFDSLRAAAKFALDVSRAPALYVRGASVYQAPTAELYFDALKIPDADKRRHLVLVQASKPGLAALGRLATEDGANILYSSPSDEADVPLYEYGWNHTTLLALKKDKEVTYLQAAIDPDKALEQVRLIEMTFPPTELLQHLEAIRFGDGKVGFGALPLVYPNNDEHLQRLIEWHEENGITVFNPHTHVLEDGGMKQTDWAQLGFKKKADPFGVLNPGKMRAWDEDKATVETSGDGRGAMRAWHEV